LHRPWVAFPELGASLNIAEEKGESPGWQAHLFI
jgi:hypothetical protein